MKEDMESVGWKRYPLFCICVLFTLFAVGQRARLFSTDNELSNSLISDIHQDHKGIIWITTEEGINRYDGSKFTVYREKEDSILSNYVRIIFEDSNNQLFFGFFNGLQSYDHSTDQFTTIPLLLENGAQYPAHVMAMMERHDGTKLVATSGHGLFRLEIENGKTIAKQQPDLVPSYYVNEIFEDSNHNLWISTQDKGLYRASKDESLKNYLEPQTGIGNDITSICEDNLGNLYVGSLSKGLFKYNAERDLFEQISYQGFHPPVIVELHPIQHDNRLLIGTDGEGMMLYDPQKNLISKLNFNVSNFDFSKSKVHTIMEDREGNYWLGLFQKGVALIPARTTNFKYIGYQSVTNNIIGSNYIMSLLKDQRGRLWVGTDSDGLYGINLQGERLAHYESSVSGDNIPSTVMCMFEDSEGTLWVGSYLDGLSRLNRKTGQFDQLSQMVTPQSNPVTKIFSITEDSDKNLWVATMGFGLFSMNLETGVIKNYNQNTNPYHPNDASGTVINNWISSLLLSRDEQLYIGTADGISRLDISTMTFTNLNVEVPQLWGQIIQTLHEDQAGIIWIGTTRGLMSYNPHDRESDPSLLTTNDGLPSDVICSIEEDDQQNLWISTNSGISKFNPGDSTFLNFYYHDGLQGNEFSKRASFKDDQGRIYFGGINGITYFEPDQIRENTHKLSVEITGFYLQDRPVTKGTKSGNYDVINSSVMESDTFHLAHNDNSFSIEFSTMEYMNPKRITYIYTMRDDQWITLQQGTNTVSFNNLEPGKYEFKVKAKDFSTFSPPRALWVIIHPAWYLSSWAKFVYFLVAILFITGIVYQVRQRYKTRKRMREHRHSQQINEAKLEFFTNISHEIKTPLSLILNPLKKLIATEEDTSRLRAYSVIRRNTERVMHLVNQLMDLRKIDKGKISLKFKEVDILEFIRTTTEIFEEQLQEKHIQFRIQKKGDIPKVWVDPNYFDKPIQNVLSNAIKFTPKNGEIQISLEVDTSESGLPLIRITCTDTGSGINENEIEKIFDRFYQSSDSQESTGSGIGLHLTRSIVELHHGTIKAKNNPEGGSQFTIEIPVGKDHLSSEDFQQEIDGMEHSTKKEVVTAPIPADIGHQVKSKSKKWVLVVDDDKEIRQYICEELASDYHMIECANGKEGLSSALEKKPNLIISDVMMPEMDGITLCRKIKQNVNINHIPVILLTARSEEKDNLEGLGIGADAYISKPFNMEILRKTVENIIKNRELLKNNYGGSQLQSDKVKSIQMKSTDEKLMQKIMDVINDNISNPDLNVEMIANEIGISRVHLYRKLKELTNQSVRDLIRNIRLKQAAELLSTKNLNVSEIAYATGFSNPSKFSSSFKDFYGVSPKNFAQKKED